MRWICSRVKLVPGLLWMIAAAPGCGDPGRNPSTDDGGKGAQGGSSGGGGGSAGSGGSGGAGGAGGSGGGGGAGGAGGTGGAGGAKSCGTPPAPGAAPGANKWAQTGHDGDGFVGYGHVWAWDSKRDRLLLTGGERGPGYQARFFSYDGTSAFKMLPDGAKAGNRAFHGMVYDVGEDALVVFGGIQETLSSKKVYGDTLLYREGSGWEAVSTSGPSARYGHDMVYDSKRKLVWLFGGADEGKKVLDETWKFDTKAKKWEKVATSGSPGPRAGHSMGFHEGHGHVYFFGGYDGSKVRDDTWSFDPDSKTWCELPVSGGKPKPRQFTDLTFHPKKNVFVMVGGWAAAGLATDIDYGAFGDTWVFDPGTNTWRDMMVKIGDEAGGRPSGGHAASWFGKLDRVVIYGGSTAGTVWHVARGYDY